MIRNNHPMFTDTGEGLSHSYGQVVTSRANSWCRSGSYFRSLLLLCFITLSLNPVFSRGFKYDSYYDHDNENVLFSPILNDTLVVTACDNYTWVENGQTYYTSGIYSNNQTSQVLALTIEDVSIGSLAVVTCGCYNWNGSRYDSSGIYSANLQNTAGCDSMATLELTINHPYQSTITAAACDSYLWNGTSYTASGNYSYSALTASGCDSIVN